MNQLKQEFIIHPVGQGLFYSGKISFNNTVKFRMIFDCGSLTSGAGEEEVEIYRNSEFLNEKIIDLLIISHFDADHVKHIGSLLKGKIHVKKLVMPFLTFEERLFLVLKYFSDKPVQPDDDFFIRFAINPLATIDENLEGDSEVYLIEPDPNKPIDGGSDIIDEFRKIENESSEKRFKFIFTKEEEIKPSEDTFILNSKVKSFKVDDSAKGIVLGESSKLMEFVFYRKKVSSDEKALYDEIGRQFYDEFNIDTSLTKNELLSETVEKIRTIKSSTKIKKIFQTAKKNIGITKIDIRNLNITALSLLHRNLPAIFKLGSNPNINPDNFPYFWEIEVHTIHKFLSSRVEKPKITPYPIYSRRHGREHSLIFPNVLLTSDSFLLKRDDVDKFTKHYEKYWGDFWLFQIPHHGSDQNSNDVLHSHLALIHNCFINYGIGNRDNHPSESVIHSLVATGNSSKIIPVNQIVGLRFSLSI